MPSYLEALEMAVANNYDKAIEKLEETLDEYENKHTGSSPSSIFLLMKIASINKASGNLKDNEEVL